MKFSSNSAIFATVATLALAVNSARAAIVCPPSTSTEQQLYSGSDLSISFSNLVEAAPGTNVTIYGEFTADLDKNYEYADVGFRGGQHLFRIGQKSTSTMTKTPGGSGCYSDSETIEISAKDFNAMRSSIILDFSIPRFVHTRCTDAYAVITITVQKPKCANSGSNGDPHFKTWKNEHFEFHGQCDMILAKDTQFADGVGLDVQIRTKIVRFWSYIHTAAIRIGNDILEIQGSPDKEDRKAHYWFNFEYQADTNTIGGFPLTVRSNGGHKRFFEIDLRSKFPGQTIVLSTFREFVAVDFKGGTVESFGNTVGLLGDYKTGKTLARDGATEIHDFSEFGDEWQVLPSDLNLFREFAHPRFPELCIKPEDPHGQQKRRLAESIISIEQAESACAPLKDPLSIKDCVYDILATQDLDMVGAF